MQKAGVPGSPKGGAEARSLLRLAQAAGQRAQLELAALLQRRCAGRGACCGRLGLCVPGA